MNLNNIIQYWSLLILLVCTIAVASSIVVGWIKRPTSQKIADLKEVLLTWTILAEKELGSGTGVLKLRYVYDIFIRTMPALATVITFESFSKLVDEVLEKTRVLIEKNKDIKAYVNGEKEGE